MRQRHAKQHLHSSSQCRSPARKGRGSADRAAIIKATVFPRTGRLIAGERPPVRVSTSELPRGRRPVNAANLRHPSLPV
jgi:hypothetical protein